MHYFLRNYRINAKIHNCSRRLHVLGWTTQAQLPNFTFVASYYTRLWSREIVAEDTLIVDIFMRSSGVTRLEGPYKNYWFIQNSQSKSWVYSDIIRKTTDIYMVVYFKSHHCNSPYGASARCTSILFTCYLTDREHFNTHH